MPWLAVTLAADGAVAESLGDALLEGGAESVSIADPTSPRITLEALFSVQTDVQAKVGDAARACGLSAPSYTVARVEDQDWVRRTQAQFPALKIGERLWIVPSWREAPQSGLVVRLDPGLAFGTGSHPTTRLALRFLERHVNGGERVLDYGCGSGILAIAAGKLGAGYVCGTDIEPGALETAAANARANGIALDLFTPDSLPAGAYDMVVANILAQPLIVLAPLLAARVTRGGRVALSGILESQATEVASAYEEWFEFAPRILEEGWALLSASRR